MVKLVSTVELWFNSEQFNREWLAVTESGETSVGRTQAEALAKLARLLAKRDKPDGVALPTA